MPRKINKARQRLTDENRIIKNAKDILLQRLLKKNISCPSDSADYLRMRYAASKKEIFGIIGLNVRHYIIAIREIAKGTSTEVTLPIRNIIYAVLKMNAAAVILYHCHPSGRVEPSREDFQITHKLKRAFDCCEIQILDHIIVGYEGYYSFADAGNLED